MRSQIWLPLLVVLAMVLGCSEDDDSRPKSGELIRFSVDEYYFTGNYKRWVIISDAAGEILEQEPLQNGSFYEFDLPSDREGDAVTLTIVQNNEGGEVKTSSIVSYTDVLPGDYSLRLILDNGFSGSHAAASLTLLGDFRLDDPSLRWITPKSWGAVGYAANNTGLSFQIEPFLSKTALLVTQRKDTDRYLYTEVEAGQKYERSAADFKTTPWRIVSTPEGSLNSLQLWGRNALGEFQYYYTSRSQSVKESIPLPMIPEISDTLILEFYLSDDVGRMYNTRATSTQFPTSLPVLDGSIDDVAFEDDVVRWKANASKSADGIEFYLRYTDDYSGMDWLVVGAADQQGTTLPRISRVVAPYGPSKEMSFTTLASLLGVNATLVDYPDYNGYQDYLSNYYLNRADYKQRDYRKLMQEIHASY